MASWLTRLADTITPWDRGGERQRRDERRKREEEERQRNAQRSQNRTNNRGYSPNVGSQQSENQNQRPDPKKPLNIFEDLNKNLVLNKPVNNVEVNKPQTQKQPEPGDVIDPNSPEAAVNRGLDAGKSWEQIAREGNLDLESVKKYSQATRPDYGITVEKPKQSFFDKVRDQFDANTEADKYRRQEGNRATGEHKPITLERPGNIVNKIPVIGFATEAINTGIKQFDQASKTVAQKFSTDEYVKASQELRDARASGDPNRIAQARKRADDAARRVDRLNRAVGESNERFTKNDGGLFNTGTLYDSEAAKRGDIGTGIREITLPSVEAAADLYTLGQGALIGDAIKAGGAKTLLSQGGVNLIKKEGGKELVENVGRRNVGKLALGNYLSGDVGARSEGADTSGAVKSGLINTVLGGIPDVLLPELGRFIRGRLLPNFGGKVVSGTEKAVTEDLPTVKPPTNIPVEGGDIVPTPVNVRNITQPGPVIKEVAGDANIATPNALIAREAADTNATRIAERAFDEAKTAPKPDPRIEGVTPRTTEPYSLPASQVKAAQDEIIDGYAAMIKDLGEGNGTGLMPDGERYGGGYKRYTNNVRFGDTKGKRMTKAMWREEAERQLRAGEAEPGFQKGFNEAADPEVQQLLARGEQPDAPQGRPIQVQEVKNIPVEDKTVVPTDVPETPGAVRPTVQTEPTKAKSAQVAAQSPPTLPTQVQEVLDNPKQFNKRQVQAARNQRKMARQVAKAQEETADAMERINAASPAKQTDEGFVSTGEFNKGRRGNIRENVSIAAEKSQARVETANMSPGEVISNANQNISKGAYTPRDFRNLQALVEGKRIARGTAEYNQAKALLADIGSKAGQFLREQGTKFRRSASANEIINRYESRIYGLADDPTKIDSKLFDKVEADVESFVQARDEALAAYNRWTESPTDSNLKAFHAAQDAADKADLVSKQTEYSIAKKLLKGNKDVQQARELQKLASDADLGKMDYVDSAMLSGTGTMLRNLVNAVPGTVEEGIFGKPAAIISSKLNKATVGGGLGRGTLGDVVESAKSFGSKAKAMKQDSGSIFRHPIENLKTYSTLGNELGDTVIDATARQSTGNYYRKVLQEQGYKGKELADRLSVMTRMDPEDMLQQYQKFARIDAGLSGGNIAKRSKWEIQIANGISDVLSAGKPSTRTDALAKALTRVTVGFPSAVLRATGTGVKRLTGIGSVYDFAKAVKATDPVEKAMLTKQAIKELGAGATVIPGLFYTLGQAGLISGSYPRNDPVEAERWKREGISENSIKIGDAWYQYPAFLGAWSAPAAFWGNMGRTDGDFVESSKDMAKSVLDVMPTDQISKLKEAVDGRYDAGKFAATFGANVVRSLTPAGALLNQVAKAFDPTANDTNSGTVLENFVDKVMSGIPGVNNMANIPSKEDDAGNEIQNPNALQVLTGATSKVQGAGEERSRQIQSEVDSSAQQLSDLGILGDNNLRDALDDEDAVLYDKAASGKQLDEKEIKSLKDALVKGVSSEGTDTAYLERGEYDTNLAVLRLKRQLMEDDKTVKPSSIKDVDTAIKRGEIYRDSKVPYDMIEAYRSTEVTEWRKMGDPEADEYDPDMYQKLWDLDKLMTSKGVSFKKGALDKAKYYEKESKGKGKSGRSGGRGGSGSFSSEFGKLKPGTFSPKVQEYESIDVKSGGVPRIAVKRPNIVHKISASR